MAIYLLMSNLLHRKYIYIRCGVLTFTPDIVYNDSKINILEGVD